ncbi:MAG: Dam family site-specific DNA-(adenine-N6)-methyltransferase [Acholeplasmataceae bacterium]
MNEKMLPLLKWAGGKRKIARKIIDLIDHDLQDGTYFEPFLGGGAVLFELLPNKAVCFDYNRDLIEFYNVVKSKPEKLIRVLDKKYKNQNDRDFYYETRELDRDEENFKRMGDVERAARFMYLNKTCYNGLWRVNSNGYNNVPFGRYVNPKILDEDGIRLASRYFNENHITFYNSDFSDVLEHAKKGDLIYFDPPYDVEEKQSEFVSYTKNGFSRDDQIRLKNVCDELVERGAVVAISNSKTKFIQELFKGKNYKYYTINDNIKVRRVIASNVNSRKLIEEVLIIGRLK